MGALGSRVVRGLVVGPVEADVADPLTFVRGDHPTPGTGSELAGRRALALAARPGTAASKLVLISGGASALMAAPAEGLTLEDKRAATRQLLMAGVTIHELNTVRKHLSAIKGGWLRVAAPGPVVTLAISDVVGDDAGVIGSGPTVPDASTFQESLAIVSRAGGPHAFPEAVWRRLERGAAGHGGVSETPKPGDPRFADAPWTLIGGRQDAMEAAAASARGLGYDVVVRHDPVVGEAREAAAAWLAWVRQVASGPAPLCVISSGETTVRVRGRGRGGRNQELALAAVDALAAWSRPVILASVGTDGVDGPTDAAGAVAASDTLARASGAGLGPPSAYLADNDAYRYFEALGDLVRTGPTGTNVGDLQVCLIGSRAS